MKFCSPLWLRRSTKLQSSCANHVFVSKLKRDRSETVRRKFMETQTAYIRWWIYCSSLPMLHHISSSVFVISLDRNHLRRDLNHIWSSTHSFTVNVGVPISPRPGQSTSSTTGTTIGLRAVPLCQPHPTLLCKVARSVFPYRLQLTFVAVSKIHVPRRQNVCSEGAS